ncbi:MAG: hypothetical protein MI919_33320, partial [Holophagales bacterium]|nr:hypothetical protein [Holophagales bacterium]
VPKLEGGQGALPPSDWVPLAKEFQGRFRKLNAPLGGLGGEEEQQPSQPSTSATTPSFGGKLEQVQAPPPPAALPEFGPGLLIGTQVDLAGKMTGKIVEVDEAKQRYMIAFDKLPKPTPILFTRQDVKVLALPVSI